MWDMRSLAGADQVRRVLLPAFARLNPGDVTIRHHWTGDPMRLHSFRHKGYWFHGRRREADVLSMLQRLVRPGDRVIDAGGHIGYFSVFFARLVGPGGAVHVFEPSPNNLPYLRQNTHLLANTVIHTQAVSSHAGREVLFMDDLTGQNSSLGSVYYGLQANAEKAHTKVLISEAEVEVIRLDDLSIDRVDVIKIDIEGGELNALRGAQRMLSQEHPLLMVEISAARSDVSDLLRSHGYQLLTPSGEAINDDGLTLNVFALHRERHKRELQGLLD